MKIHEELLELSRKADKIINLSNDFCMNIFKTVKEKASAIMACKTLEDLKELSKSTEPAKKYKKFHILLEEPKVHLHSNKSSFVSTSEVSDQNIVENTSELEKEDVSYCKQISYSAHGSNRREFLDENCDFDTDVLKKKTNKTDEFSNRKFDSKSYQRNFEAKNSTEINSQNFVKINNFHSTSVEISSEASTSKDIDGIYSSTNLVFEKHRNVNILEKIEENNEGTISQKFVNVSTIIKTSYSKSSNEISEEVNQNERNSYSRNINNGELYRDLSVDILQLNVEKPNCNTNFALSNDSKLMKTSSNNKMPQNFQTENYERENPIVICSLKSGKEVLSCIQPQVSDCENQLPLSIPCSIQKTVPEIPNIVCIKTGNSEKKFVSSKVLDTRKESESNSADNLKSGFSLRSDGNINPISAKDNTEINEKQNKVSKKKFNPAKNIQGVSAIPVLIENKEPDKLNSKMVRFALGMKKKLNARRSSLLANNKGYNLRSLKNNPSLRTHQKYSIKSSKSNFNKNLALKEKVEEKKKIREQKMKLTRERRENLEKARKERLRLSEERRIKRFEQHNEILKRKIMEVKNKAKCKKLSKQLTTSSEVSPDVNPVPQSSQIGLDRTYLVENLKGISPIEPIENAQVRSSGEGLNHSLLYSSAYDKKIFMRQSVVLSDIAQMLPAGTIQKCLNISQNKEVKSICNRTPNCSPKKVSKIEISGISKNDSTSAPIKIQMRSTRKISIPSNHDKRDEVGKRKLSNSFLTNRKEEKCEKMMRNNDTQSPKSLFYQDRKRVHNPSLVTCPETSDSVIHKSAPKQTAKENDTSALTSKLRSDPKLSMESYVVLENLTESKSEAIHSEIKILNEVKKVRAVTSPSDIISSDPKLSVLTPVVVLKGTSNIKSNHSRLMNETSKTEKVSFLDKVIQNNPKLPVSKPGLVLKDVTNSKSIIQAASKKLENVSKKDPNNKKRKAQRHLNNKKPNKKPLVSSSVPENLNKPSTSPKEKQSSDITSYELSDIGDNSDDEKTLAGQKPKKIPTWASNIHLKQALFKQHYEPQDTDAIFGNFRNQKTINMAGIFAIDKPEYHNRTSSAKWSADESPI